MNSGITGNGLYIAIVVLFTIYFMAFPFSSPPVWIHLAGIAGVVLFILRIARGDD
ncbi:MAG: hypothetical protein IT249_05925 [Chitinophagaceae bacterium]|nr:hypothetical protein [Chitinophagaceae bacterium]